MLFVLSRIVLRQTWSECKEDIVLTVKNFEKWYFPNGYT